MRCGVAIYSYIIVNEYIHVGIYCDLIFFLLRFGKANAVNQMGDFTGYQEFLTHMIRNSETQTLQNGFIAVAYVLYQNIDIVLSLFRPLNAKNKIGIQTRLNWSKCIAQERRPNAGDKNGVSKMCGNKMRWSFGQWFFDVHKIMMPRTFPSLVIFLLSHCLFFFIIWVCSRKWMPISLN